MMGGLCMLVVCVLHALLFCQAHMHVCAKKNGKQRHIGDHLKGLFKINQLIAFN